MTTFLARYEPRRATAGGTTRTPLARSAASLLGRELGLDLVEEGELAGLHEPVLAQAKAEQHRLLDPLVDGPLADAVALGDADLAGVEAGDHLIDGGADLGAVAGASEARASQARSIVLCSGWVMEEGG